MRNNSIYFKILDYIVNDPIVCQQIDCHMVFYV